MSGRFLFARIPLQSVAIGDRLHSIKRYFPIFWRLVMAIRLGTAGELSEDEPEDEFKPTSEDYALALRAAADEIRSLRRVVERDEAKLRVLEGCIAIATGGRSLNMGYEVAPMSMDILFNLDRLATFAEKTAAKKAE